MSIRSFNEVNSENVNSKFDLCFQLVSVEIKPSSEADNRIQEDCAPGKPFSVFTTAENQVGAFSGSFRSCLQ